MKNNFLSPHDSTDQIHAYHSFLAIISGFLLFLSFPKIGLGFIAWIAFVPLFIALRNVVSIRQALILGGIAGITANIGLFYWIVYVTVEYGHLPYYQAIGVMLLLVFYLSTYISLFATGIVWLRKIVPFYLSAPVLWLCLEYIKTHIFTGVPWENLGYSQYQYYFLIQIADVAGVHGLSFLVMLLNVTIYQILIERSKTTFVLALSVILIWIGVYVYGITRIDEINKKQEHATGMNVSLVQGNIDQSIKWNENYKKETIDIYEELSLRHHLPSRGLLVWPETATPFDYQDEGDLKTRVTDIAKKSGSWFIFGSMSYEMKDKVKDYFNSAYLLSDKGDMRGKYDKVHLVPYGEYVPLRKVLPFVTALAADIGDFTKGKDFYPLEMDGKTIGVLICYEGVLAEAARKYKNDSAGLLVNITNDAWFGTTSAPYQHFSMTIFRAVETRLYLVRAANTGISAIIDPTGKVVRKTDLFKKDVISGSIKFIKAPTIYAKYGDWIVFVSFVILAVFILWGMKRRFHHGI